MSAANAVPVEISSLRAVRLQDGFFAPRQTAGRQTTIPSALARCAETGRLDAFKLTWQEGMANKPHIFWDSDVAKIVEGMAQTLIISPDAELAAQLDNLVDLIISAQQPDGYLNTYFTQCAPDERWKNVYDNHELYCAGHLIEAATAHYYATGSRKFLDAMSRYAAYIATVFGRNPGQIRGYPGHEEIELALFKLYQATGDRRHLDLAAYFIDERGQEPSYFSAVEKHARSVDDLRNRQAHCPVREQRTAVGHAVRAVYLYAAMVDIAAAKGDTQLLAAAAEIFNDIAERQMYIIGGIGQTRNGEAFTDAYDLPNLNNYAESCAAVGLLFFAWRLLNATGDGRYAEVVERVIYNNGLSGLSLSGDKFFYANPMSVDAHFISAEHIQKERQPWFSCSCCPTTYCRFLPQLGSFCYAAAAESLRIDIPAAATITTDAYQVQITGGYPYDGDITVRVKTGTAALRLRIPAWCREYRAELNGKPLPPSICGYIDCGICGAGDILTLNLTMRPELVYAAPQVTADFGMAALQYGPLVYCAESVDNNGVKLDQTRLPAAAEFTALPATDLPAGTVAFRIAAETAADTAAAGLYRTAAPDYQPVPLTFVPYALWQNRSPGEMRVFFPVR